ncbi:MAG: hypothetical protein Q8P07_00865 [bacterium]|nr:hypothetical protein [bacterium]
MGLLSYLQNKFSEGPAIIGTTNTLAKHFLKVLSEHPNLSRSEIYFEVLQQRYALITLDSQKLAKLKEQIDDKLGFKGFVIKVLNAETALAETDVDFIWRVSKTVEIELKKYSELPK